MKNKQNAGGGATRRQFLLSSGTALAGVALGGALGMADRAWAAGSEKKIRIGIVGGGFGSSFCWHEHPNCVVQAVSDLIPERRQILRDTYKCGNVYPSLEELIKDKSVDAVAVFTGAPDHVRHSVACLNAGKHVISAVPAAMNTEQCYDLVETVEKTGLTYMMAETSYYSQAAISARKFFREGEFGSIYSTEAEYHHAGVDALFFDKDGKPTWRHGIPPMLYPTHCTAFLVGVTGERLASVSCVGWGDDSPLLKGNQYKNPFWNETAFFKTSRGNALRVSIYWKGAHRGTERAQWYGDKMSFFCPDPNGLGPIIVRSGEGQEKDDAGFVRQLSPFEQYDQPQWWKTDMLPEPLRHESGHDGSHTFLTHEFIDALMNNRKPTVDIYEALAYTVPGIAAHESALKNGALVKIPCFDPKARPKRNPFPWDF